MRVVDQPVEDTVGQRGIADLLVPPRDRQLRSEDGRADLIAILADLPEVAAFGFRQRGHGPIIDHQYINASESGKQIAKAAVSASDRQVAERRLSTDVKRRVTVATCLLGQATPVAVDLEQPASASAVRIARVALAGERIRA